MKINYICFITALILIMLASCDVEEIPSGQLTSEKILRYYDAICINDGTTYITATFLTDAHFDLNENPYGSRVVLTPPANVIFNGQPMEQKEELFSGVVYKASIDNNWPSRFEWMWTDNQGQKHIDSAAMDPIDLSTEWLVNQGSAYAARWQGSPIRQGEEITISIELDEESYYYTSRQVGARNISLPDMVFGIDPFAYYSVEITRTLRARNQDVAPADNIQNGSFIKLHYIRER